MACLKVSSVLGLASAAADLTPVQTELLWTGTVHQALLAFAAGKHDTAGELCLFQLPESSPSDLITTVLLT